MTTKFITLNVWDAEPVRVKINQGEVDSRFLEVQFIDKNQALSLERKTVFFYAEKPDGNLIFNECEVTDAKNGTVNLAVTSQMSLAAGTMRDCEFQILDEKLSKLKIKGLILEVKPCTDFDSAIESTSEFSVLDESLKEVQNLINSFSDENIIKKITSLDGAGSGIDADLLDGKHGNEYAAAVHKHTADDITSGTLPIEKGGTGASTQSEALANLGTIPVYTSVNDFISYPCTMSELIQAMPSPSILMVSVDSSSTSITDLPCSYGILNIHKRGNTRVQILYNRSYEGTANGNYLFFGNYNTNSKNLTWNKIFTNHSGCQIPIENGGTGATTAAAALTNLGAQAATDNTLNTTNKTIVGAINELYLAIQNLS